MELCVVYFYSFSSGIFYLFSAKSLDVYVHFCANIADKLYAMPIPITKNHVMLMSSTSQALLWVGRACPQTHVGG